MKVYEGMELQLLSFLASTLAEGNCHFHAPDILIPEPPVAIQ